MPYLSQYCNQSGPGLWCPPCSLQPSLENGFCYSILVVSVVGFNRSSDSTSGIIDSLPHSLEDKSSQNSIFHTRTCRFHWTKRHVVSQRSTRTKDYLNIRVFRSASLQRPRYSNESWRISFKKFLGSVCT